MHKRRLDGVWALGAARATTLVAIGNFDGVHRGHQAVIEASVARARAHQLRPLVLTFHPHPAEVLGGRSQRVLTPLGRKVTLLTRLAPDLGVVVEPFTKELAAMSPGEFVETVLVGALGAREVIVGQNFRFGAQRSGDLGTLRELGFPLGLEARAEPLVQDAGEPISSTRIRALIEHGRVSEAEQLLGRPHALSGLVVEGQKRGRTIGFPTVNLANILEQTPADGVYATLVDELAADGTARALACGVTNLGVRPTVEAGRSVETHLLDFQGDLYGRELRLHFIARLRDEQRFGSLAELTQQLARDVAAGRHWHSGRNADPIARGGWH
jgi:riboflavin kinase/FMN adenylyltransferase